MGAPKAIAVVSISRNQKHSFLLTLSSRNGFCIYVFPTLSTNPIESHSHYIYDNSDLTQFSWYFSAPLDQNSWNTFRKWEKKRKGFERHFVILKTTFSDKMEGSACVFPPSPLLRTHPLFFLSGLGDASQVGTAVPAPCNLALRSVVPRAPSRLTVRWWGLCAPSGRNASWIVSKTDADWANICKSHLSHQILIENEQLEAMFPVDSPGLFLFFCVKKLEREIRKGL